MKLKRWLYIVPAFLLACTSCGYSEDPITPSGNYSVLRFDFPQGNNDFDREIEQIHDEYGFYVIYKDITLQDLNRKWTSVGTDNTYYGNDVPDADMPFYVSFLKERILEYMDVDMVKKTFPIKFYFMENFRAIPYGMPDQPYPWEGEGYGDNVSPYFQALKTNGFDYWAMSLKRSQMENTNPTASKQLQCAVLFQLILQCKESGVVSEPAALRDGIDFETRFPYGVGTDDPNHPYRRGFINWIYDDFGTSNRLHLIEDNGPIYLSYYQTGGSRDYFMDYVKAAMWYTRDEFVAKYPTEQFPLITEKFDIVVDYFNNTVGIDLQGIAEGK